MESDDRPRTLAINVGSSSLKFELFAGVDPPASLILGSVDRIGLPNSGMVIVGEGRGTDARRFAVPDHDAAMVVVTERLARWRPDVVGHRVVHGGRDHGPPERVTPGLIDDLRRLIPLDPDHLPAQVAAIEAIRRHSPDLPQVACFDTAFHRAMPRVAKLLPIPRRFEALGARRYGFHGLSYAFLMDRLAEVAGPEAARGRVILAHLGSGASLAAVRDGEPVDTTMGFTPSSGLVMGTRTGDIDPGLVRFLMASEGMTPEGFDHLVNRESGLLGVSETSPDVRELLDDESTDPRAAEALALFCYSVKKAIGAMAAALGGLDTLVFSGGIGGKSPAIRARICEGLGFLGITLDPARNAVGGPIVATPDGPVDAPPIISTDDGPVAVLVILTHEELMIARLSVPFLP